MNPDEKAVYLTFDDGPIPEVTPWVLSVLDRYNVKATFFMVGDNVHKFPNEFRMVVDAGQASVPFTELVDGMTALGKELGLVIHTMHEDIFNFMHKI